MRRSQSAAIALRHSGGLGLHPVLLPGGLPVRDRKPRLGAALWQGQQKRAERRPAEVVHRPQRASASRRAARRAGIRRRVCACFAPNTLPGGLYEMGECVVRRTGFGDGAYKPGPGHFATDAAPCLVHFVFAVGGHFRRDRLALASRCNCSTRFSFAMLDWQAFVETGFVTGRRGSGIGKGQIPLARRDSNN